MVNKPQKIVYTAVAQSTGGRGGQAVSTDPDMALDLRVPVSMGGPGGGTNPEQLFAMGYGACFQGAMGLAAKEMGVSVDDSVVRTSVGIGPEGESYAIAVKIEVFIPNMPIEQVREVTKRTHQLCPYSKATRDNVPVEVISVESL